MYSFYCIFKLPFGWFLINILIPIKALLEYGNIHEKILNYVLKRNNIIENNTKSKIEKA
jgi:hypothetical protein